MITQLSSLTNDPVVAELYTSCRCSQTRSNSPTVRQRCTHQDHWDGSKAYFLPFLAECVLQSLNLILDGLKVFRVSRRPSRWACQAIFAKTCGQKTGLATNAVCCPVALDDSLATIVSGSPSRLSARPATRRTHFDLVRQPIFRPCIIIKRTVLRIGSGGTAMKR
jgi:hypothetical protein